MVRVERRVSFGTAPLFGALLMLAATACAGASSAGTPPATSAPTLLDVDCDGTTTTLGSPTVQAEQDGVHLLVHNTSSEKLLVGWSGGGVGVEPGETRLVFQIPPGETQISCLPEPALSADTEGGVPVDVVATEGWISPDLQCGTGGTVGGNLDYVPGATGVADPLADAAKRADGAEVQQAGYRTRSEITVVALHDGMVTASYGYVSDRHGGWLLTTTNACS